MNVVVIQEVGDIQGSRPIRCVLLTSLDTTVLGGARQVIADYDNHWLIEEYHKVIETGCSIESHALRSEVRLEPMI